MISRKTLCEKIIEDFKKTENLSVENSELENFIRKSLDLPIALEYLDLIKDCDNKKYAYLRLGTIYVSHNNILCIREVMEFLLNEDDNDEKYDYSLNEIYDCIKYIYEYTIKNDIPFNYRFIDESLSLKDDNLAICMCKLGMIKDKRLLENITR